MSNIPVWEGDYKNRPANLFSFKGEEYTWELCDCGCKRPLAYKNGDFNFELTIRLRGTDQGDYMATVLVKLGKMEELVAAGRDHESVGNLLEKTLMELLPLPGASNFDEELAKYDVTELELIFATGEAVGIPVELTEAMLLSGLSGRGGLNAREN